MVGRVQEQFCFYHFCYPLDPHADGCDHFTVEEIIQAARERLTGTVQKRRQEREREQARAAGGR